MYDSLSCQIQAQLWAEHCVPSFGTFFRHFFLREQSVWIACVNLLPRVDHIIHLALENMRDSRDNWMPLMMMRLGRSSRPGEDGAGRTLWSLIQCDQNLRARGSSECSDSLDAELDRRASSSPAGQVFLQELFWR